MPTPPTLAWVKSAETSIPCAGATVTYAEFLNTLDTLIGASTYWNSTKSLDAGNTRGYIELRPKSATAGITEGRCLILFNTGTVGAATPNEKPSASFRLAPWSTATTTLTPRLWVGMSPNAATTGPTNDPYGTGASQPYTGGSTVWTKLIPLNSTIPPTGQTMWIIESNEAIAVCWTTAANTGAHIIFGKFWEAVDSLSTEWALAISKTTGETTAAAASWSSTVAADVSGNDASPPFGCAYLQHSAGTAARAAGIAQKSDGTLYGLGRIQFSTVDTSNPRNYAGASGTLLEAVVLGGGTYTGGAQTGFLGFARQMRWGPAAKRSQTGSVSGVTKAYHLTYDNATAQGCGIWFHNDR